MNKEIQISDFNYKDILSVIRKSKTHECAYYSFAFSDEISKIEKINNSEDNNKVKIFQLFYKITSFYMNLDSKDIFRPMIEAGGKRSALPIDLTENEKYFLFGILPQMKNNEIKARIADVLWLIKYPPKSAYKNVDIAINAYIKASQKLLNPSYWFSAKERLERAFQLSKSLGKDQIENYNKVHKEVEKIIFNNNCKDEGIPSSAFIELLLEYSNKDLSKYISLTQISAEEAEKNYFFDTSKLFWELNSRLYQRNIEQNSSDNASISLANEALKKSAYQELEKAKRLVQGDKPQYMLAASHIETALLALRNYNEDKEKLNEIHKLLIEYQSKAKNQVAVFEHSVDVTKEINHIKSLVKGKDFQESVLSLAKMCYLSTKEEIKSQVEELNEESVFRKIFTINFFNRKGKNVAKTSYGNKGTDDYEKALLFQMNEQVAWNGAFQANLIYSAIQQIKNEHNFRISDFDFIVKNNGFIPSGHEQIFAMSFYQGLNSDFLSASHLLIPQFENSLRYLLEQRGEVTSTCDSSGIQKEKSLEETLKNPIFIEIFGEDVLFILKAVFSEGGNGGLNLRNELSHGLIPTKEFIHGSKFIYAWHLILWICCIPILSANIEIDALESI